MAVVDCYEFVEGRNGKDSLVKVAPGIWKIQRTYVRVFVVETSDVDDSEVTVLAAGCLPARGDSYATDNETDDGAIVKNRSAAQDANDPLFWLVTIDYDSDVIEWNENPFERPAEITIDYERFEKFVRFDNDGNAIVNSARQPIDPPLSKFGVIGVINISINKTQAELDALGGYAYIKNINEKINNSEWLGFPAYTVLAALKVKKLDEGAYHGWTFDWTLRVKDEGWNPTRVLDSGFYELTNEGGSGSGSGGNSMLKQIRDVWGNPISGPSLLNGQGRLLPPGEDPVELQFNFYTPVDFSSIP